jgi:putative ABC transport system permease protein
VLGVSIGLALIMITVNGAFAERLDDIRASVGTDVTVRPAGTFGGGGFTFRVGPGGPDSGTVTPDDSSGDDSDTAQPTITDDDLNQLTSIPHVASITRQITAQYTGDSLKGAEIEPPAGAPAGVQTFTPPILVTGTDDPNKLTAIGDQDTTITSGRTFSGDDSGENVAVIGKSIADANSLEAGGTFTLDDPDGNPVTVTVIGIYTTGTTFGDNAIAMPIDTVRELFDRGNEVDQATVRADSVDNVEQVSNDVKSALGEDKADVTTAQSLFASISAPLSDAKNSSEVGMYAALVASAIIILFSIGLVARQRIREIGILKAVGASNWNVVSQFSFETVVVAVFAALAGAIATFPLAQTVADNLVSDTSAAGPQLTGPGGDVARGGGSGGAFFISDPAGAADANGLLDNVNVAVSAEVFLYAIAIAIGLALLATIVPAWYVGRVRPAEVLRHE